MIKEEFVEVPIGAENASYYERLGYDVKRRMTRDGLCVKRGTKITVRVEDISKGSHVPVTKVCDKCGKEVPGIPIKDVYKCRDSGVDICRSCSTQEIMERRNQIHIKANGSLLKTHPEVAEEWDYGRNKELRPENVLSGSHRKAHWVCKDCSHRWVTSVYARSSGTGCPICRKSRGEREVYDVLTRMGLCFVTQVSYPGLVGIQGLPLSFDFLINTSSGKQTLIEYDGEHHFMPATFGRKDRSAETMYRTVQEHDRRKDDWCKENDMPLLRINYSQFYRITEIIAEHMRKIDGGAFVGQM